MENDFLAVLPDASLTCTVNVVVCTVVGRPMTPVVCVSRSESPANFRPSGTRPEPPSDTSPCLSIHGLLLVLTDTVVRGPTAGGPERFSPPEQGLGQLEADPAVRPRHDRDPR
jgi:hypothetical protein